MIQRSLTFAPALLALALLAGCSPDSRRGVAIGSAAPGALPANRLDVQPVDTPIVLDDDPAQQYQIAVDAVNPGSVADVTRSAVYDIDDASVATINSSGLLTPVGVGTTTLTVGANGMRTTREISVVVPALNARIIHVQIYPPYRTLPGVAPPNEQLQQMVVVGFDATGRGHDVTRIAALSVQDMNADPTSIATINRSGLLRGSEQGECIVIARQTQGGTGTAGAHIVCGPGEAGPIDPTSLFSGGALTGSANPFDRAALENLFTNFIEPSPLSTDEEFIRRLYADALGRLPRDAELSAFLTSAQSDKRAVEIDTVIAGPEFASRWANLYTEWFRMQRGQNSVDFEAWARSALGANTTMRQMLVELSEGRVSSFEAQRPLPGDKVDVLLEAASGMDVKCARCHAHFLTRPGDEPFWTAENRFQLDAFFATTPEEATPHDAGLGGLRFGLPVGNPQQPGFALDPTQTVVSVLSDPLASRRAEFAQLFANSTAFYKGLGHRIFAEVMAPLLDRNHMSYRANLDSMVTPNLLDTIALVFESEGTSLQGFLRVLFNSAVYQLSSETSNPAGAVFFASHAPRRLHAEVMAGAVTDITGGAIAPADLNFFYNAFGWPEARAQVTERRDSANTSQGLIMMNSPIVADAISDRAGLVATMASDVSAGRITQNAAISRLFRQALSREPVADELGCSLKLIQDAGNVRDGLEDVLAVLLNSAEFAMR